MEATTNLSEGSAAPLEATTETDSALYDSSSAASPHAVPTLAALKNRAQSDAFKENFWPDDTRKQLHGRSGLSRFFN